MLFSSLAQLPPEPRMLFDVYGKSEAHTPSSLPTLTRTFHERDDYLEESPG